MFRHLNDVFQKQDSMAGDPQEYLGCLQRIRRTDFSLLSVLNIGDPTTGKKFYVAMKASLIYFLHCIMYVLRPANERDNVWGQVPTIKHGRGNVMVWGCFSPNTVGPQVEIEGRMDSKTYQAIILKHMLPHARRNMPRNWQFQQDNNLTRTLRDRRFFLWLKKFEFWNG